MKKNIIKKEKKKIIEDDKLNLQQELFCQNYVSSDKEFFGNGVQSYINAYNPNKSKPTWYKTTCVDASQLLSNPKVSVRINELLESRGLNDENVDKQILFLINQHSDFSAKIAAIKEYNQLRDRIKKRIDLTSGDKPLTKLLEDIDGRTKSLSGIEI